MNISFKSWKRLPRHQYLLWANLSIHHPSLTKINSWNLWKIARKAYYFHLQPARFLSQNYEVLLLSVLMNFPSISLPKALPEMFPCWHLSVTCPVKKRGSFFFLPSYFSCPMYPSMKNMYIALMQCIQGFYHGKATLELTFCRDNKEYISRGMK